MDTFWIRQKFLESKQYWPVLEDIIKKDFQKFENEIGLQLKAERIFEILCQIIIDICTHIISNSDISPPRTYSECIKNLYSLDIISKKISDEIASMVKMRNIIVHQYGDIDYYLLLEGLKNIKNDYLEFQRQILKWIENQTEKK